MQRAVVDVVIPALNEQALPHVLAAIPEWVRRVVVADNDRRTERLKSLGKVARMS